MPNSNGAVAAPTKRDLATLPLGQAIELFGEQLEAALPPDITIAHFKRMLITAVNINPKLLKVDRRSFFNEAIKCASDGLLPDGREAVMNPYKIRRKIDGNWVTVPEAKYIPMVAGVRKRMRNSGEVASAIAEVVYRNDTFHYRLGDAGNIEHEPPPLDEDRGPPVGAYAIIRLKSGEVVREVMSRKQIEQVQAVSQADADSSPWKKWPDEMWRKTVLKRCSKQAPQAATLARLLSRDDEDMRPIGPAPPRPRLEDYQDHPRSEDSIAKGESPPDTPEDGQAADPAGDAPQQQPSRHIPFAGTEAARSAFHPEAGEHGSETDGDLPPHVLVREQAGYDEPDDDGYDADTGEVEEPPAERHSFWSQEKLFQPVLTIDGQKDWETTKAALLALIRDAESVTELARLEADSKTTITQVGLALKSTIVTSAIKMRLIELRRVDTAGNPLSAMDAG